MKIKILVSGLLLAACFSMSSKTLLAEESVDPKPFAEARVVLQLSDQEREAVVLDVANNLIKYYGGPDVIDIEIVTFGKGIRLLFADSEHETRIASLVANGVRFYVCENTLDTMERQYGSRPEISEQAIFVRAGVAHLIEKVADGYTLVKP
jgi:intracellular sulfur oxidation DsrE/DsrF family protein